MGWDRMVGKRVTQPRKDPPDKIDSGERSVPPDYTSIICGYICDEGILDPTKGMSNE